MSEENNTIALTIEVVASYVSQNNIRPDDLPAFIASTHAAISGLENGDAPVTEGSNENAYEPAVSVRKSLASKDHIISLIDGKPYKTLKRHLATNGLTPAEYRQRYGLKPDYPMVAPTYSETRKALAQKIGLGRKVKSDAAPAPSTGGKAGKKLSGAAALKASRSRKQKATSAPEAGEA